MGSFLRNGLTALLIAGSIQLFTVGVLAPNLPSEVCRPGVQETRTLTLPKARLVHINNADGGVSVTANEGEEILLTAYIRAYPRTWSDRAAAVDYVETVLRTDRIGDTLSVITEPDNRPDNLDLRVDYTISVPRGTSIGVVSMHGNVSVGEGLDRISVKGNFTDVKIANPQSMVMAKSVTGRIEVTGARGETTLETVNGGIIATIEGGKLEASTTTGSINATLLSPEVASCDLTVMNGDITLVMPEDSSAKVHAVTGRGSISSDMPIDGESGMQRRRELQGLIGEGKTRLMMNSLNGNIRITRSVT